MSATQPTSSTQPRLSPDSLTPYFVLATLVHLAGIASRFDALAAELPPVVPVAMLMVQFPLLVTTGYFESQLDHGTGLPELPLWMRIRSRPLKLALTFGLVFVTLIPLQTWNVSIGPLDPTPPTSFPLAQRAMWFTMFTVGMAFPFYLFATGVAIPILRVLTFPLRYVPHVLAATLAATLGGGIGIVVLALMQSQKVGAFIGSIRQTFADNPALGIGVSLVFVIVPIAIGLIKGEPET